MNKIRIGLYGNNGHQIGKLITPEHPDAELTAVCFPDSDEEKLRESYPGAIIYKTLDEMLSNSNTDLISLCSPKRADQVADALKCLNAHKHVYAEKPAAFTEEELDMLLSTAKNNNVEIHEMTDAVFAEPFWTMRKLIQSGKIGEVIQVYAQKSYPSMFESRPQEDEVQGGLIRWVGIHAICFIEHITGLKVVDVEAFQTHLGNITSEGLHTAASLSMALENGAVASACINYLKPLGFSLWGKEAVTVFGSKGIIEINDGGLISHIYTDTDEGQIEYDESECIDLFNILMAHLNRGKNFPLSVDEEFHPLRTAIRAVRKAICKSSPDKI